MTRRIHHRPQREWCSFLNHDSDATLNIYSATNPGFASYARTGGRSLSIWVNLPALPPEGELSPVFSFGGADGTGTDAYWLICARTNAGHTGNGNTYFCIVSVIQNSLSRVGYWTTTPLVAGAWQHLVVMTSGTSWSCRVNNVANGTVMVTNSNNGFWWADNSPASPRVGVLGANHVAGNTSSSPTDKRIKLWQLTMWNKQLTGTEIGNLYNNGAGMNPRFHSAIANLTDAWWLGQTEDFGAYNTMQPAFGADAFDLVNLTNANNRVLA